MRDRLSRYFVERSQRDPEFVVLSGDHGYALFDELRRSSPHAFINAGVAEQNMVGVAAGMAREGARPLVYGLSSFVPVRVLEQIKLDVCCGNLPVTFLGDGAGVVYSKLGVSHQSLEDIACLRALPNLTIYSPADRFELELCLEHAEKLKAPCYLRLGKADRPPIHKHSLALSSFDTPLLPALKGSSASTHRVALIATGSMASTAVDIAKLDKELSNCDVYSMPLLKPAPLEKLASTLADYRLIFTLEEHCVVGGLGSLIAETVAEQGLGSMVLRCGSPHRFSDKVGSHEYVLSLHGLDQTTLFKKIHRVVQKFNAR